MSASGELSPVERSQTEVDLTDRVRSRMAADRERTENTTSEQMKRMALGLTKMHDALVRAYAERVTGDVTRTHAAIQQQLNRVALTSQNLADSMQQAQSEQSLFKQTVLAAVAGTSLGLLLALIAVITFNLTGA